MNVSFIRKNVCKNVCCAIECGNTIDIRRKPTAQVEFEKIAKILFRRFPFSYVRKAEWIRILRVESKIISSRNYLCSLHFKNKYIDRTSSMLKENAVPHIFEHMYEMDTDQIVLAELSECLNAQMKAERLSQTTIYYFFETKDKGTNTFSLLSEMWKPTQDKETKISPERIWNINFSNMETIRKANSAEIKHLRKRVQSDKSGEKTRKLTL